MDDNNILEDFLNDRLDFNDGYLQEVSASMVKVSKDTKRAQQAGLAAMRLAKENNDPLYTKYSRYRERMLSTKKKIQQKYGSKGRKAVRQSMR